MNWNHLAIFHAVAEEKSVSRAAERLMISQPAVSKQLSQMERSLGTPLFDRLPRGMRATEAGNLLAGYARRLFSLVGDAEQAIGDLRGLHRGRLSIGASTTVGVYVLPDLLVRFRQKHPGVQLKLEIAASDVLAQRLLDGTLDLALTEGIIEDDALESSVWAEDRLVAIGPPGHPLTRKRAVTLQLLCREPFVVRETGSGSQSLVERALMERGVQVKAVMSLGSTEAIKRGVAAGVGVAIVSHFAVALEVQARRLSVIRVPDLQIVRPIYRVQAGGPYRSASAQAFGKLLDAVDFRSKNGA